MKKPSKTPAPSRDVKWLIIPDTHVPYHDRKAFALMVRAAVEAGATNVCILGDFLDCHFLSEHSRDPRCTYSIKDEIDVGSAILSQLEKSFRGQRVYCEGNHEERYPRQVLKYAPETFDAATTSIAHRLKLGQRRWKWVPYREHIKLGPRFYATHDFGSAGKAAHMRAVDVFGSNVVFGHTHRMGVYMNGDVEHGTRTGVNMGWLGDPSFFNYLHAVQKKDWQLGFGLATQSGATGFVHITAVPIVKKGPVYECYVAGKLFRAE